MRYIKQLDSIRAIAVIFVIISHWFPSSSILNRLPNGPIGVDIFFVLSGYLITKILFLNKEEAQDIENNNFSLIKNFYIRRTLRIFPIYYITIIVLLILQYGTTNPIFESFGYFATYTSNFYFFINQGWGGMISHLWSLAVEEQFYLIWPWLIIFINRKYYFRIIITFILIGVFGQIILNDIKFSSILTFNCFDAFGLGSLLSWVEVYKKNQIQKFLKITSILAIISLILFIFGLYENRWIYLPLRTIISLIALYIIGYVIHSNNSKNIILNNKFLINLGKISYGLYLYHNFIPHINNYLLKNYINRIIFEFLEIKNQFPIILLENTILLIILSWVSYQLIEVKFLNLKKYFEYNKKIK